MVTTHHSETVTATTDCWFTVATSHGIVYPLTPCCGSTGKGLMDERTDTGYIGCRRCYRPVSPTYGDAAMLDQGIEAVTDRIRRWIAAEHPDCPTPHTDAVTVVNALMGASEAGPQHKDTHDLD